jgi:hypothetical protein
MQPGLQMMAQGISDRVLRRAKRRERDAEHDASRPVDGSHLEELEARMDLLRMAIELEDACDFGDRPGRERPRRVAFFAHFPELEGPISAWNEAVESVRGAPSALWSWYAAAAARRGISEPPFAVGPLIDRLAIVTAERSRNDELGLPRDLTVESFRDRVGGVDYVSVFVDGQNVGRMPGAGGDDPDAEAGGARELIQKLFDDAQRTSEAEAVGGARDTLLDLKQPLLEELAMQASADAIAWTSRCPVCAATDAAERDTGEHGLDSS